MEKFVYLDYQATTPTDPRVVTAMLPFFTEQFGNPGSLHRKGIEAEIAVMKARRAIAAQLEAQPQELVFTSGATEANNLAIKGLLKPHKKGHIITVATEHKSVLNTCYRLAQDGFGLTVLPVDKQGLIDLSELEKAIQPDTVLISVMYGNNETGVLQPIQAIGEIAKTKGIFLHCDVTQSIGHLRITPAAWGIHLLTFSGHKIYGPKGIGVLYIATELLEKHSIQSEIDGGGQEKAIRSGTLNVPGIIGIHAALGYISQGYDTEPQRLFELRNIITQALDNKFDYICNSPIAHSLPHCLNLSFPGIDSQQLLQNLNDIAISTVSACSSSSQEASHVLRAMEVPPELINGSLRLSVGRFTTTEDIEYATDKLLMALARCKKS